METRQDSEGSRKSFRCHGFQPEERAWPILLLFPSEGWNIREDRNMILSQATPTATARQSSEEAAKLVNVTGK